MAETYLRLLKFGIYYLCLYLIFPASKKSSTPPAIPTTKNGEPTIKNEILVNHIEHFLQFQNQNVNHIEPDSSSGYVCQEAKKYYYEIILNFQSYYKKINYQKGVYSPHPRSR